jgi:hypothetical protein
MGAFASKNGASMILIEEDEDKVDYTQSENES